MTGNTALGFCLGLQSWIPQALANKLETGGVLTGEFAELPAFQKHCNFKSWGSLSAGTFSGVS